jgi:hypothetical protein
MIHLLARMLLTLGLNVIGFLCTATGAVVRANDELISLSASIPAALFHSSDDHHRRIQFLRLILNRPDQSALRILSLGVLSSDVLIPLDLLDAQRQSLSMLLPSFISLEILNDLPRLHYTLQSASVNAFES